MNLLQLAYHYPPMGGAGVQRAMKFSKYLPDFGIRPIVLAAHEPGYVVDASLLAELPPTLQVERIEHVPLLTRLRHSLGEARPPTLIAGGTGAATPVPKWKRSLRDIALKAYAISQFPDDKAGWARRAFDRACELVRSENIDMILSTAPPYSAHALAARVAAATGRPWVADYRDLWTDNPGYVAPKWRAMLDRHNERRWLASATGVVAVTPMLARILAENLPDSVQVAMIPNGYDESDFTNTHRLRGDDGRLRVAYVGTFYGHQSPIAFLAALEHLLSHEPTWASTLCVRLVGNIGARFASTLCAFEKRWPRLIERVGFVPHSIAVQEMLDADLLLLVIGGGSAARGVLTGKLFEYMRTRLPVLLLGPDDGDAADLLRHQAAFAAAPADDMVAIAETLARVFRGKGITPRPASASPERFERRALTGELAAFLYRCLESSRG